MIGKESQRWYQQRRYVVGGGAATLAVLACGVSGGYLCGSGAFGKIEGGIDQGATENYLSSLTSTLIANETQIVNQGLTPTPGFTETVVALAAATGTPLPTLTLTPSPTPTPEATSTPSREQIRKELLSSQEVTPWDAGTSLPVDTNYMYGWMTRITQEITLGNLQKGDIRTYDQIIELTGNDATFWSATDANHTYEGPDGRRVWVSQAGGSLSQAKYADEFLKWHVSEFTKRYGGDGNLENSAYLKLRNQIYVPGSKEGMLLTRNTYPGNSITRESQPEAEICSAYIESINVGEERKDGGVLILSNKAITPFIFVDSDHEIDVDDPQRLAGVGVDFPDGRRRYLFVRMFDLSSRPRPELFGSYGLLVDDEAKGGWGSQILPPCGVAPKVEEPSPMPENTANPPGNPPDNPPDRPPTNVPTQPPQDRPPTNVPTQPAH